MPQRIVSMPRSARRAAVLALIATFVACGLALAVRHAPRATYPPSFAVYAAPTKQTVVRGESAKYGLWIYQRKYRAAVSLRIISRLPAGVSASIPANSKRSTRALLRLRTSSSARAGTYRIRVRGYRAKPKPPRSALRSDRAFRRWRHASAGRRHMTATVRLTIRSRARPRPIAVGGYSFRILAPGVDSPIDAWVSNPHRDPLRVHALTTSIASIDAPRASTERPCGDEDFAVRQYAGAPFVVPPRSARRLSELGVTPSRWPHVVMLDRPINQDGCKGAHLKLAFSGSGRGGS